MKERPIPFTGPMVRVILEDRKTKTRRVIKPDKRFHSRGYYPGDRWHFAKHPEGGWWGHNGDPMRATPILGKGGGFLCPYGVPGDRLWVREHWGYYGSTTSFIKGKTKCSAHVFYHADESRRDVSFDDLDAMHRETPAQNLKYPSGYDELTVSEQVSIDGDLVRDWWKRKKSIPSIHMPRWASRINLEVLDVKVERVQDITEEDAIAEGVRHGFQMNGGWPDYQHIKNGVCELTQDSAKMSFASLWDSVNGEPRKDGVDISWKANPWVWVIEFRRCETKGGE